MAFILAQNGCSPAWDGRRPLTGGADEEAIKKIKSKGGGRWYRPFRASCRAAVPQVCFPRSPPGRPA